MRFSKEMFEKAIAEAIQKAKKRNFLESVDLTINFRNIDFKKPENRIEVEVVLPKGRGKPVKIAAIVDKVLAEELKKEGLVDKIITKDELQNLDKKAVKKLAKEFDFFVAEPAVMPLVGKIMGPVLGPRKKMPKVLPPNIRAWKATIENLRKTVVLTNKKGKPLPTVHAPIGVVTMSPEDLAENAMAVIRGILGKVNEQNIRSIYVKTTMGPAVRVV
ncbi:MAG: 50S ribosomal protein L1 [Candidatus Diapherotrites archaeon]|nr:50S ribosomal protein L1 [Candidatus Diapherotrites archaeon]